MKRIAITMGEPGGIGPEVIVKALNESSLKKYIAPIVVGSAVVVNQAVKLTGLPLKVRRLSRISDSRPCSYTIEVLDDKSALSSKKGVPSRNAGRTIVKYIKTAAKLAMNNDVKAIVTAPISKESIALAGYSWPGHTELLAELTGTDDYAMMFASKRLKVILCTTHIPLKDVPKKLNGKLVLKTIRLAEKGMGMLGVSDPSIAVSGLNPHAGEAGIMGAEEDMKISPAVGRARLEGINVSGPYPPDVVFYKAVKGEFDIVVCMYHDQGLIPFKMIAFEKGVNVTVGLPFVRTSPDHGTAFNIAWQNKADPSSMIEAIKLASKMKI
jgi:4-hydroxythreonine-4-phosphate dehydrogenase